MLDDGSLLTRSNILPVSVPSQRDLWDRWHKEHDHASHRDHAEVARECFLAKLGKRPARVLEIGCGQGRDAISFAMAGLDVVALDYSSVALDRVREKYERMCASVADSEHGGVKWYKHDYGVKGLMVEDESFDAVYAHLSLHYFNDKTTRRLFEDIARVLRPGGLLFCTVRSQDDELFTKGDVLEGEPEYRCYQGHVRRFFSESYLEDLLSGWQDLDLHTYIPDDTTVNPGTFIRVMARAPRG